MKKRAAYWGVQSLVILSQAFCLKPECTGLEWGACLIRLLEGELYNGRVAMLAVLGILSVELLGKGPWWSAPFKVS